MPVHNVYLRDYVRNDEHLYVVDSLLNSPHNCSHLPVVLEQRHQHGDKVHLIGFDGQIVGINHLRRQAAPWYNPLTPDVFVTAQQLVAKVMPKNIQQCVNAVCFLKGDRQNRETLKFDVQCLYDAVVIPLVGGTRNAAFSAKLANMGLVDNEDFQATDKLEVMIHGSYGYQHLNFQQRAQIFNCNLARTTVIQLLKEWQSIINVYGQVETSTCSQYRCAWRRLVGSNVDCRTYQGQPDRDMNLANVA